MILREINILLKPLVHEIKRARQLDLQIQSLEDQVSLAKARIDELAVVMAREEDDVIRLQNRNLPVLAKRWEREQAEFHYAKKEYDEALYMTAHMNQLLRVLREQRSRMGEPEQLKAELLQLKEKTIVDKELPAFIILLEQEEKILELEAELLEVEEAEKAVQAIYACIEELFEALRSLEYMKGIWWTKERNRKLAIIEDAAFDLHRANHKLLRELVDIKRTYTLVNGDRMTNFYHIFLSRLRSAQGDQESQIKQGKNLCRSQVYIVNKVFRNLNSYKRELENKISILRNNQNRIIEYA